MKIAFFSDVHANLPALEAVLEDIEKQEVEMVFCLGDLVNFAPWPNAVIEEINKRKIPTIAGNHDLTISNPEKDISFSYLNEEVSIISQSKNYTNACLKPENRKYLKGLPRQLRIELGSEKDHVELLLVHGSEEGINGCLSPDVSDEIFRDIFERKQADFIFFGQTHKPFYKHLRYEKCNKTYYKHAISTGSVGKPKDGDPRACYVILSFDENSSLLLPDGFKINFIRVPYNIDRSVKAIMDSPLPDELAEMLRRAY